MVDADANTSPTRSAIANAGLALAKSHLFQVLPAEVRARLVERGQKMSLEAGAVLFTQGDPGDALYIVLDGEMEARRVTGGGTEVRLASLGPGAMIGEMAVLDGGGRSADIVALSRTQLLRLARPVILRVLEEEPRAALAIAIELSVRLRAADTSLVDGQVLNLAARLAELLLLAAGGRDLASLTQTEMARRISASREKVNRKLHAWSREGVISLTKAGVRIERADYLRAFVARQRTE